MAYLRDATQQLMGRFFYLMVFGLSVTMSVLRKLDIFSIYNEESGGGLPYGTGRGNNFLITIFCRSPQYSEY